MQGSPDLRELQRREANAPGSAEPCPPPDADSQELCLLVGLREPFDVSSERLVAALTSEGFEAGGDGSDTVSLMVTPAQIRQLFGARLDWGVVPASSYHGFYCQPFIRGGRIPRRFRQWITEFGFDPQVC